MRVLFIVVGNIQHYCIARYFVIVFKTRQTSKASCRNIFSSVEVPNCSFPHLLSPSNASMSCLLDIGAETNIQRGFAAPIGGKNDLKYCPSDSLLHRNLFEKSAESYHSSLFLNYSVLKGK